MSDLVIHCKLVHQGCRTLVLYIVIKALLTYNFNSFDLFKSPLNQNIRILGYTMAY